VLDGNNPRFPWKPSATKLTYRLAGTTDETGVNRGGHRAFSPSPAALTRPDTQPDQTTETSRATARLPPKALYS
jgi:hypothetical protein